MQDPFADARKRHAERIREQAAQLQKQKEESEKLTHEILKNDATRERKTNEYRQKAIELLEKLQVKNKFDYINRSLLHGKGTIEEEPQTFVSETQYYFYTEIRFDKSYRSIIGYKLGYEHETLLFKITGGYQNHTSHYSGYLGRNIHGVQPSRDTVSRTWDGPEGKILTKETRKYDLWIGTEIQEDYQDKPKMIASIEAITWGVVPQALGRTETSVVSAPIENVKVLTESIDDFLYRYTSDILPSAISSADEYNQLQRQLYDEYKPRLKEPGSRKWWQ